MLGVLPAEQALEFVSTFAAFQEDQAEFDALVGEDDQDLVFGEGVDDHVAFCGANKGLFEFGSEDFGGDTFACAEEGGGHGGDLFFVDLGGEHGGDHEAVRSEDSGTNDVSGGSANRSQDILNLLSSCAHAVGSFVRLAWE